MGITEEAKLFYFHNLKMNQTNNHDQKWSICLTYHGATNARSNNGKQTTL